MSNKMTSNDENAEQKKSNDENALTKWRQMMKMIIEMTSYAQCNDLKCSTKWHEMLNDIQSSITLREMLLHAYWNDIICTMYWLLNKMLYNAQWNYIICSMKWLKMPNEMT